MRDAADIDSGRSACVLSIDRMDRLRRVVTLGLLALAIVATLGHICMLPGHVHAAPAAEDDHHDAPTAGHHDADGDAVHAASCDVVRPGTIAAGVPSVAAVPLYRDAVVRFLRGPRLALEAPQPTGSPPLYLVHRVLLI
jgi:hypothetical protein